MAPAKPRVAHTDKTTNLEIDVTGERTLDEMEATLLTAAASLGLYFSRITTLGAQRFPGNRHWHLKQDPRAPGCLDVTYWPAGPLMWISIRHYEPPWVHESGRLLREELQRRVSQVQ